MRLAIQQSRRAIPACLPNPPVGCVFVRNGDVIATGFTLEPGNNHAEAAALSTINGDLSGVTAFVTLEPCSFRGRTPSCAKELVERGLDRIFVAVVDPDPRNAGAGIKILEAGGVDTQVGLLSAEALEVLSPYLALEANAGSAIEASDGRRSRSRGSSGPDPDAGSPD